jgi:hypothetical protein
LCLAISLVRNNNYIVDEMNLLKITRWIVQPQSKMLLFGKPLLVGQEQVRWQTTDIPPQEGTSAEVSTKVTPMSQSNLMEFFETGDKLYDSKIVHGKLNSARSHN